MNWLLRICNIFVLMVLLNTVLYSQQEKATTGKFGIHSAGVSLGWFNPSMDYWKRDSAFKDANFSGAFYVSALLNIKTINDLHSQIGLGYWQENVKYYTAGFGNTNMLLSGFPVSLDLLYQITPLQFSMITPYLGLGGEFLFVQHKLVFEQNTDPPAKTGSTVMGYSLAGFEAKLSDRFAVDFEFQYKFGNYKKDFKSPIDNTIITETISLNGPKVGVTLKYFL